MEEIRAVIEEITLICDYRTDDEFQNRRAELKAAGYKEIKCSSTQFVCRRKIDRQMSEPSVDRVREENEIVEKCADIGLYDDDDFTPPSFIDELKGDNADDFWEWIQALLKASARNAIGMWTDREGGNER